MALALGLAAMLVSGRASEPPRVELEWQSAACDEADRTRVRIDELLPPGESGPAGRARVQVVPDGDTPAGADALWTATVEIETADATVTRTLRGGPCSSLTDAIALVVAVTVDPLGASARIDAREPTPPEPDARPTEADPPAAPPPLATPDDEARALRGDARPTAHARPGRRPDLSTALIVEAGGAIGLLPRIAGRLGGTFALGIGAARVSVTGLHAFARPIAHPQDDGTGAEVALSAARLSGGWSFAAGRFTFPLCAGIEAGAFTAVGFGLEDRDTVRAAWVAVVSHAQPTLWATPWLGVGLHVEAPISLLRPRFGIDDFPDQDLVRVGPVGFRFGLSIEARFFDEARRTRRRG